MSSTLSLTPAGNTVALNVANAATSATITSLVPVSSYYVSNTGNNPVQLNFNPLGMPTAVFATAGSNQVGVVLGSQDDAVINIPAALTTATQNGFVTSIYLSAISNTSTVNSIYITPVQGS